MAAYLIVEISVDSNHWVKEYRANVPAILQKYGGEYVMVSRKVLRLEGEGGTPDQIAILRFPAVEAIQQFLDSDEYRPYAKARIAASYSDMFAIEV